MPHLVRKADLAAAKVDPIQEMRCPRFPQFLH